MTYLSVHRTMNYEHANNWTNTHAQAYQTTLQTDIQTYRHTDIQTEIYIDTYKITNKTGRQTKS